MVAQRTLGSGSAADAVESCNLGVLHGTPGPPTWVFRLMHIALMIFAPYMPGRDAAPLSCGDQVIPAPEWRFSVERKRDR